jgi:hypothetical protein
MSARKSTDIEALYDELVPPPWKKVTTAKARRLFVAAFLGRLANAGYSLVKDEPVEEAKDDSMHGHYGMDGLHSHEPGWVHLPAVSASAALHELLMPPHPGSVYQQSALCSCGDWQWDSDSITLDYKAVLLDHRQHALAASPAAPPALDVEARQALQRILKNSDDLYARGVARAALGGSDK